jgi:hypothetical protein
LCLSYQYACDINRINGIKRGHHLKYCSISGQSVKSWFFTRFTPTNFAPPSARCNFFKCAPLTWNPGSAPEYHRRININFKGTGIFDLKRTQIYTHTFAWSEVIDEIEFWSCLYCVESVCITCGSEQDTLYKIIYTKMCIWCKTMYLIPHSLLAIFHV